MFEKRNTEGDAKIALRKFIEESPQSRYRFDSEREANQSEICRSANNGEECKNMFLSSKKMFEAMQDNGFFCALPMDPEITYIECKPIPRV